MVLQVRYLAEEEIESDAGALLRDFYHTRGVSIRAPIPIEDIVEKHLGLSIDFDDLHRVLDTPMTGSKPDIFGAIWVDRREIIIDESLDPEDMPEMEGRYRFTLAHEGGGHWRLHQAYLSHSNAQASLFGDQKPPAVICRTSEAKQRVEWQADYYASCLLMPRPLVLNAWRELFGSFKPVIYEEWKKRPESSRPQFKGLMHIGHVIRNMYGPEHDYLFDKIAGEFAPTFEVSRLAMRIRLEKLGLLLVRAPSQTVFESMA